jgi:uncharacterized protein GlcG (DUF336 family)
METEECVVGINLDQAAQIVDSALSIGRTHSLMPLTVVVLDTGGHVVALKREDGSGIVRAEIATGKAWGSLGMGVPSRLLRDRLADRPTFVNSLSVVAAGRFVPVPGGVLIHNQDRRLIGAVGISGDTSDKDEFCAIEAVKVVGLIPAPEDPVPNWADSSL